MDSRRPHPHYTAPPPPSSIDSRAPPLQPYAHPQQQHLPQHHQQHPSYSGPPPPPPPPPGPALPPIQQSVPYGPPGPQPDQHVLPPFRSHPAHHPHDPREAQEHFQYHNRSSNATPAPVNRSYSHDSAHQRTPTTPAQPGPYTSIPPPDSAPPQLPHPMEHGAHHGYPPTNGVPHSMSHPGPPGPPPLHQHHESHSQYMTPVMENHHPPYGPPPPQQQQPMYPQPNYGGPMSTSSFQQVQRKKQMRATQACEQCRQRKQKCDEGAPCSFCKENNLECQYRDTPPAKTDKNMERLLQHMEAHSSGLSSLTNKIDSFDARLRRLEHAATYPQRMESAERESSPVDGPPIRKHDDEHRTAPHKLLLLWPSVNSLLMDAGAVSNNFGDVGYVMQAEDRGVLRLYTRGEGIDEHDGTQPGGPASPARSEDSLGEIAASTPPEGLWGTGLPQTPGAEMRRSEPSNNWGGLKPDNSLDLDASTLNALYDSYMRNIHIMHPILDKQRLRKLFDSFIKRYCMGPPKPRQAAFAVGNNSNDGERPMKRQRFNHSTGTTPTQESGGNRSMQTERSPSNAIIYLVCALGKICLHKEPLPGPVPESRLNANQLVAHQLTGSHSITGSSPLVKPSPISPKSTPTTQPTPPAEMTESAQSHSRRGSFDGVPSVAGPRNIDVIPGLAYYAKGAEILGDQGDGNDLVHAQMFLLAGLYKGQLGRVKESMSWITTAGRTLLNLLDRYKLFNESYWHAYGDVRKQLERSQQMIKDKRHNLIVIASWTCLQLESDISAEMRFPSSGIQDKESQLILPHRVPDDETYSGLDVEAPQTDYDAIILWYQSQIWLRKRLNRVQRELYGADCLHENLEAVQDMLQGHEAILSGWRQLLPPTMRWHDDDKPPPDVLAARLRGKYWGARYIVNRPFLDFALHIMPHLNTRKKMSDLARNAVGDPRDAAELHLFEAIKSMDESVIWDSCKRCIEAAEHSTVAFDGVPDRLIVTNIHGTAHAQFGNVLVLSATYYSKSLGALVNAESLRKLLERTITFLRRLAPISKTCEHDCSILEKIQTLLFGPPRNEKHHFKNEGVGNEHSLALEPTSATSSFNAST